MNYHPASNLFPLMTGADLDALTADIAEHGQREPIWLHPDGSILDGRNRWRACEVLGIAPLVCTWDGEPGEEEAFVVSLNLHRRHLDRDQRAEVMRSLRAGGMTYQKIADTLGVDTATAYRATRDVNLQTQIENERGQARPPAYERKRIADEAHSLIRCYLPFGWQPITVPVAIRYDAYQIRPQDADNIASKLYTDGLVRAGVLAGDDWQHVRSVTTATHKASVNSLTITIFSS